MHIEFLKENLVVFNPDLPVFEIVMQNTAFMFFKQKF